MANTKITELTALASPETTDVVPIVDVSADVTKKVNVGEIVGKITGDVSVGTDGVAAIGSGVIVDADVNASAAINGTKVAAGTTSARGTLQLTDSTSSTSTTLAATANAVKVTKDVADAALPKAGGTLTGAVTISNTGSLLFEGATDNAFETTLAVADPTADRTITLPDTTGTVALTSQLNDGTY
jgi:hypothetical protein